jgi:hypothetical protein
MRICGRESYEIITTESCTKGGPFFRHRRRHKKIKRAVFHTSSWCSLMTVPSPPPQQVLQTVRYGVFSFDFQYLLVFLRSSRSCLCLLPLLSFLSTFHSVTCFRKQFLSKKRKIHLTFLHFIVCRIFLFLFDSVILLFYTIGLTDVPHPFQAPHFKTLKVFLICFLKCPSSIALQNYVPNVALY